MSLDVSPTSSLVERSDSELIDATRAGSQDAYAELWRRHAGAGRVVARSITSSLDPDDLVSESFARIYQAILRGKGPTGALRPYLFTTIRNTAAAWGRARRETSLDTLDSFEDPDTNEASSLEALDRSLSARAFRSLPTRWQEVLWYTEIEGMTPAEVGPLLGMKANSVSALAYRAREGLREAWIQAHLRAVDDDSEHAFTISRLGSYARGNLSARDTTKVESHLDGCQRCTIVAAEAKDVGSRMALVLLPLVAGAAGATGYLAWLQTDGHAAATAVAMPAGVTGTAVLSASLGAHAAAPAAGAAAAGGAGAGGAGAGAASQGGLGAAGASTAAGGVAVGAAGLSGGLIAAIVVGVVAAGTAAALVVGPMVFPASGESDTSSVAAAQVPAPAPAAPSRPGSTPTTPQSPPPSPSPAPSVPVPVPAPSTDDDGSASPVDDVTGGTQPATPVTPTSPAVPTPTPTPTSGGGNGTNGDPTLTVDAVDTGGGKFWPILSGTAPAGSLIEIVVDDAVVDTVDVTPPAARRAAPATGTWTSNEIVLDRAGPFTLTVRQVLNGTTTVSPAPISGSVSAPQLAGLLFGFVQVTGTPLTITGPPGASISYSIDGGDARTLVLDGSGVSAPIESDVVPGSRSITLRAVDLEDSGRTGPVTTIEYVDARILLGALSEQ